MTANKKKSAKKASSSKKTSKSKNVETSTKNSSAANLIESEEKKFATFDPHREDRFLIEIDGIASYLIKGAKIVANGDGQILALSFYVPIHLPIRTFLLTSISKATLKLLGPVGNIVDTIVFNKLRMLSYEFEFDWSKDELMLIHIRYAYKSLSSELGDNEWKIYVNPSFALGDVANETQ